MTHAAQHSLLALRFIFAFSQNFVVFDTPSIKGPDAALLRVHLHTLAASTNEAASFSFVSILFLCRQYNFKGELSRDEGGKAICHRKQRKRAGSYFSRMAVIGRAILPPRGKGSFSSSSSSYPSVPLRGQKVVLFANGYCKGLSKDQNRSCLDEKGRFHPQFTLSRTWL